MRGLGDDLTLIEADLIELVSIQDEPWKPVRERGIHCIGDKVRSKCAGVPTGSVAIDAYPISESGQSLLDHHTRARVPCDNNLGLPSSSDLFISDDVCRAC